jgi:hypothetical protein
MMSGKLLNLLTSASIAVVLLFVAELVLRMLYPEKVLEIAIERQRTENLAYAFHPEYLISLKPNVRKVFRRTHAHEGDVVHWGSNSDSFRGPELRSNPQTRIIVYGDSNIQARFSHLRQTFPYRLQELLESAHGRDVEVINGGIIGSGPDQVLLRFSADVDRYKPDAVIFHVFADNDFGDIVRNRLFELDANDRLVRTTFTPTADSELDAKTPRLLTVKAALKVLRLVSGGGSEPGSGPGKTQEERLKEWLAITEKEYAVYKQGKPRSFSHFADHYDFDVALYPDSESAVTKVKLLDRILQEAKATSEKKGVALVVLIQPSSRDLTQNLLLSHADFERFPKYRRDGLSSTVDEICARHGIHRINLYPVFLNNDPQSLYFTAEDDHWNASGQELAARVTAEYLTKHTMTRSRRERLGEAAAGR